MKTYFLKTTYSATGEGITSFVAFGHGMDIYDFKKKCTLDIDPYFLLGMEDSFNKFEYDIFCEVADIPEKTLEYIEKDLPILHRLIKEKYYEVGNVWFTQKFHLNMS